MIYFSLYYLTESEKSKMFTSFLVIFNFELSWECTLNYTSHANYGSSFIESLL